MKEDFDIERIKALTKIHQKPRQKIFSFWDTRFDYFILSPMGSFTTLRTGNLICAKPDIINPLATEGIFEGFSSSAEDAAEELFREFLQQIRLLGYRFQNKLSSEESFSKDLQPLLANLKAEQTANLNACIISSPDDLWMGALAKVSIEIVKRSAKSNIMDFEERGYFLSPEEQVKKHVEILFEECKSNKAYAQELDSYLKEHDLFDEYEDRFLNLFKP